MEKEKMEKRRLKRMKSKLSTQTSLSEEKSKGESCDKFVVKNGKKTNNSDSTFLKDDHSSAFSNNTKYCQVRDTSHPEIIWNLGDLESSSSKSRRSSLLNDFECLWIPEESDSSFDFSRKSISIDLNSPEWNKIESKRVSSEDSTSETSINYDLPVFPPNLDSESILHQEPPEKSFFDRGFDSKMSNLTLHSLKNTPKPAFPNLQTPGLEFLQESEALNNFIPPPKVMNIKQFSADNTEIPAPYMQDKPASRSCKSLNSSKSIGEKSLRLHGSEIILSDVNTEHSSKISSPSKFNPHLTLRHFQGMLENPLSDSFAHTAERNFYGNHSLNNIQVHSPIHPINKRISGDSLETSYKNHSNFSYLKKSCSYGNPSGLLEHFPEFKPVM